MNRKFITNVIKYARENPLRTAFTVLMSVLFFAMPLISRRAGMSGDEHANLEQSKYVFNYYRTLGSDSTAVIPMSKDGNLREYGQLSDNLAYLIAQICGIEDIVAVRHVICSLFGWLGILFCALLAFAAGRSWWAAIFAALLLFLSPRYLGHSFNNLKDVPFAAAMVMGVYYILRFLQTMPKPSLRACAGLAAAIALALATRVGGLLLIAYFGLFALVWLAVKWFEQTKTMSLKNKMDAAQPPIASSFKKLFVYGVAISAAGCLLAILVWPYALSNPLKNISATFEAMSHFQTYIRQLFEGQWQWSNMLPWYYTPKYIIITAPIAVLAGLLLYLFNGALKKENRFAAFVVYFAFVFPVFWIVYSKANVYGGWRHSLFAYLPMAAAAGLGFSAMLNLVKKRYFKIALAALPLLLMLNPIIFIVKNHPYEVTYFNPIAGGVKGAYGNYEMDYYYHSTRQAAEWVRQDAIKSGLTDSAQKVKVVSFHAASVAYFLRKDTAKFKVSFSRWYERGYNDWDYGIFTITGMIPELLKNKKAFPPQNTAYQIKVDGAPICIVLKRDNRDDYYGHKAMKEDKSVDAIRYLRAALQADAYNEQALEDLITIYGQSSRQDSALTLAQHWVSFNKGNTTALYHLANLYYATGQASNAILTANQIIKYNTSDISGLWVAANIYAQQGKLNEGVRSLQKLLSIRPNYDPAYLLMADLYERGGDKRQAEEIRRAIKR